MESELQKSYQYPSLGTMVLKITAQYEKYIYKVFRYSIKMKI